MFAAIGIMRLMDWGEQGAAWGTDFAQAMFGVLTPYDKRPATVGNGTVISMLCKSETEARALHTKALELGGRDEGAPGPRSEGFYAGYFRDLDGNKLNGFHSLLLSQRSGNSRGARTDGGGGLEGRVGPTK